MAQFYLRQSDRTVLVNEKPLVVIPEPEPLPSLYLEELSELLSLPEPDPTRRRNDHLRCHL